MLVALRRLSIGEHEFGSGERIPQEVQKLLPPRRIEQLKSQRHVEEITDERIIADALDELTARVEGLETELAKLKAKPQRAKQRRAA